jgi:UDP-glucose 6-dehydrogenase
MNNNISIIGIGRLGICVSLCLEKIGYNVLGVDTTESYIKNINNKNLHSSEPDVSNLLKESKNFVATQCLEDALKFSDIIFIYVATPSCGGDKHYDHTVLGKVLMSINEKKVENKHIVIGCTVIPGYITNIGNYLIKDFLIEDRTFADDK